MNKETKILSELDKNQLKLYKIYRESNVDRPKEKCASVSGVYKKASNRYINKLTAKDMNITYSRAKELNHLYLQHQTV